MGLAELATSAMRLPRGPYKVRVRRDLKVPVHDGINLLTDHYAPVGVAQPPTILVRTPYGRANVIGLVFGHALAQHGFQALVQSCRGGFGSGGTFNPFADEREDGLATVEWMRAQRWYGGSFGTYGPSYLACTQWAIAAEAGPELKAMAIQVGASNVREVAYVGGALALESGLLWTGLMAQLKKSPIGMLTGTMNGPRRVLRTARSTRAMSEYDLLMTRKTLPFWQEVLQNEALDTPYWQKRDHSHGLGKVSAAVTMVGGWHDIFLPSQLADYNALRAAGQHPQLTVGPWYHADPRWMRTAAPDALAWFRAHLLGDDSALRADPVRLYVTGAEEWRTYSDWPIPDTRPELWHLHSGGGLSPESPGDSSPTRYRYDPAHPTPYLSGPVVLGKAGPVDQSRLESRRDVKLFTTERLTADVEVIGTVSAEIHLRSSKQHTDLVARLCDVHPDGTSYNLSDGIRRLTTADEGDIRKVRVELWPVAHRFKKGHRIRLQVCSGAYPRISRNPGTGAPLGAWTTAEPSDQEIFHTSDHPSAIILPVY